MNNHRFVFAGLLGFIATTIQPQITLAYTAETIGLRAKEVTVIIESKQESGSGVIIGRQGAQYSVLTNWHVLKSKQSFTIETTDGSKHQVFPSSIQRIGNLDLAVCTFASSRFYRVVEFGNSDTLVEGSSLYITGAPANLKGIASRSVLVVGGQLVGYNRADTDGYTLIYNNNTQPGMSGGPVIDGNGNLIGIHGRGSRDQNETKSGFNLGIPINLFVKSASQQGIKYTLEQPRLDRTKPSLVAPSPSTQGRPRVVDGSEGSSGACAGDRC